MVSGTFTGYLYKKEGEYEKANLYHINILPYKYEQNMKNV
jgi:hypothetical protein